ncbi:hypothetical protein F5887DRAFT_888033 [Amanita rubescens]|nr:hypothetical protein F5887DRAFT_888033 [Amanita rubescens]
MSLRKTGRFPRTRPLRIRSTLCHSYWRNQDGYLGCQTYHWVSDSNDAERKERMQNELSLYICHIVFNCSRTCPKGLNPAEIKPEMTSE